jgi:benzoate-CoA ligase
MLEISRADHSDSPPRLHIPRHYNAAHDLIERNLGAGRAEKLAYIDDERSLTYQQLSERSAAFAHLLESLGIQREQRILLCLHDTVDFPVAFLGAIRAGIIPVPVNTLLTQDDYRFLINDARARVVVCAATLWPLIEAILPQLAVPPHILIAGAHENSMTRRLEVLPTHYDTVATCSDEPCFWLYSSGSTGQPKGAVHVHSSLIHTAELYARPILGIETDDVCFSAAKLFFAYGLGNSLTFPLSVGATTVLMAERATPAAVFSRLRSRQPTIFGGVPTLYASMLASGDLPPREAVSLRRCTSAGEPLPEEIGRRWYRHFGVDILDGIGSTEMLHIFLSNRPGNVQYGTTGQPVPGYDIRVVDDNAQPVAPGETGELQISGPSTAACYWNNRSKTRTTFLGGWTRSGDKYYQRADGCYVYAGRSDDMLKVSGIYVSPAEVEAALITHAAVLEAAVVGREDPEGLIKPVAFVVLKAGLPPAATLATELQRHVKSLLAPFKYPRWIEFIEELPKTSTGKIQRFKLREVRGTNLK